MRAYERLLHYVSFGTQSDHTSETVPSTASQKVLAADLVEEMKKIGIADAFVDDNTLTVDVTRLRQALCKVGLPHAITTHRGMGYSLRVDNA